MLQHASSLPNRYPVSWNPFFSCDGWTIMLESCKEHVNFESILLEFSPAGLFMAQKFRDCKQKVLHK